MDIIYFLILGFCAGFISAVLLGFYLHVKAVAKIEDFNRTEDYDSEV